MRITSSKRLVSPGCTGGFAGREAQQDVVATIRASIEGGSMVLRGRTIGLITLVMAFAACRDSGLPGKNLPLEEARTRVFPYSVYDAAENVAPVRFQDRTWMVAGPPVSMDARLLRALEGEGERAVFALATDSEPYTRLYVRVDTRYAPMAATP
jgi:hypothetical protein